LRLSAYTFIVLLFLTSCSSQNGQEDAREKNQVELTSRAFPKLLEITNSDDSLSRLYIDANKAEVFNRKLKDLDKSHPLFTDIDCESEMTLLAITPLDNSKKKYAIVYGYCPEPEFHIYAADDLSKFYGSIGGLNMYVTGNGNLYVSGHVNSNFDLKRKLTFTEQNITEVEQPHYYVGLKTKTLAAITLYRTKEMKEVVATLPKDYKIEVLLAETSHQHEDFYLVKTAFGLVGWTQIKAGQYQSVEVDGIFWNGD